MYPRVIQFEERRMEAERQDAFERELRSARQAGARPRRRTALRSLGTWRRPRPPQPAA